LCWIKTEARPTGQREIMRKLGFSTMKAFFALSSVGRRGHQTDWLFVVACWSSIVTVGVIVAYFLQRGS
jgi:hypothetical protein